MEMLRSAVKPAPALQAAAVQHFVQQTLTVVVAGLASLVEMMGIAVPGPILSTSASGCSSPAHSPRPSRSLCAGMHSSCGLPCGAACRMCWLPAMQRRRVQPHRAAPGRAGAGAGRRPSSCDRAAQQAVAQGERWCMAPSVRPCPPRAAVAAALRPRFGSMARKAPGAVKLIVRLFMPANADPRHVVPEEASSRKHQPSICCCNCSCRSPGRVQRDRGQHHSNMAGVWKAANATVWATSSPHRLHATPSSAHPPSAGRQAPCSRARHQGVCCWRRAAGSCSGGAPAKAGPRQGCCSRAAASRRRRSQGSSGCKVSHGWYRRPGQGTLDVAAGASMSWPTS